MSSDLIKKPYFIRLGANLISEDLMIESYSIYRFNKNFYSYYHFKITQNPNYDVSFSGLKQKRSQSWLLRWRNGFKRNRICK